MCVEREREKKREYKILWNHYFANATQKMQSSNKKEGKRGRKGREKKREKEPESAIFQINKHAVKSLFYLLLQKKKRKRKGKEPRNTKQKRFNSLTFGI